MEQATFLSVYFKQWLELFKTSLLPNATSLYSAVHIFFLHTLCVTLKTTKIFISSTTIFKVTIRRKGTLITQKPAPASSDVKFLVTSMGSALHPDSMVYEEGHFPE